MRCTPVLLQEEWDEEAHPEGFELCGALPAAQAEQPAAAPATEDAAPAHPLRLAAGKAAALQETEEGVVLLSSDDEGPATEAAVPGEACGCTLVQAGRHSTICGASLRAAIPACTPAGTGKRKAPQGAAEGGQGKKARVQPAEAAAQAAEEEAIDLLDDSD